MRTRIANSEHVVEVVIVRSADAIALVAAGAAALLGCTESGVFGAGASVDMSFSGLDSLGAHEGRYEAWVVSRSGDTASLGVIEGGDAASLQTDLPVEAPAEVFVTVEPPGDTASGPSRYALMGGPVKGASAELSVRGYVTRGPDLEMTREVGTHVLFTPSDNSVNGYPSYEDGGIWVFNINVQGKPKDDEDICRDVNDQNRFFLEFTPLRPGWMYEGWVVRDHGTSSAVWLSYGKFRVNSYGRANLQDNTGLGAWSGKERYVESDLAKNHCFPGDDWVAGGSENPFGLTLPGDLEAPLDLNGNAEQGVESRWSHVITVEPAFTVEEESPASGPGSVLSAEPFGVRPYFNEIGTAGPATAREIDFRAGEVPTGRVTITASSPGG